MPIDGLSFGGTTLIDSRGTPVGNLDGEYNKIDNTPAKPLVLPVERYGVQGLSVKIIGNGNTLETAGKYAFAGEGQKKTRGHYTSEAAAWTQINAIESLQRATQTGSLVYGSTTVNNAWFVDWRHSEPFYLALGDCTFAVDYVFEFVRLS